MVLAIGEEEQNLKIQLSARCHINLRYRYICMIPLKYNSILN